MSQSRKEELVQHYRWLRQYGYNDSHSGNASIRENGTVWVTPTGACADRLMADELVACSLEEGPGAGASSDAPLHLAVYRANPEARVLLHSHGCYSVAITLQGEDFVPADFEGRYYFDRIPVLNIAYGDYFEQAPAQVAAALARHKIVIVRGHGVYACAASVDLAYKWTCSLELSAKTTFLARQLGTD